MGKLATWSVGERLLCEAISYLSFSQWELPLSIVSLAQNRGLICWCSFSSSLCSKRKTVASFCSLLLQFSQGVSDLSKNFWGELKYNHHQDGSVFNDIHFSLTSYYWCCSIYYKRHPFLLCQVLNMSPTMVTKKGCVLLFASFYPICYFCSCF